MKKEVTKCIIDLSDKSNFVMAITSILNIFVIIWIFFKERAESRIKAEHEKKDRQYNSLGLNDLTIAFSNKINDLKESSLQFFKDEIEQKEYVNLYKGVDNDFLKYKNEYEVADISNNCN